jgi:hypothetical protein
VAFSEYMNFNETFSKFWPVISCKLKEYFREIVRAQEFVQTYFKSVLLTKLCMKSNFKLHQLKRVFLFISDIFFLNTFLLMDLILGRFNQKENIRSVNYVINANNKAMRMKRRN